MTNSSLVPCSVSVTSTVHSSKNQILLEPTSTGTALLAGPVPFLFFLYFFLFRLDTFFVPAAFTSVISSRVGGELALPRSQPLPDGSWDPRQLLSTHGLSRRGEPRGSCCSPCQRRHRTAGRMPRGDREELRMPSQQAWVPPSAPLARKREKEEPSEHQKHFWAGWVLEFWHGYPEVVVSPPWRAPKATWMWPGQQLRVALLEQGGSRGTPKVPSHYNQSGVLGTHLRNSLAGPIPHGTWSFFKISLMLKELCLDLSLPYAM